MFRGLLNIIQAVKPVTMHVHSPAQAIPALILPKEKVHELLLALRTAPCALEAAQCLAALAEKCQAPGSWTDGTLEEANDAICPVG